MGDTSPFHVRIHQTYKGADVAGHERGVRGCDVLDMFHKGASPRCQTISHEDYARNKTCNLCPDATIQWDVPATRARATRASSAAGYRWRPAGRPAVWPLKIASSPSS